MDRKEEYAVRRRAAEDIYAEMAAAGKDREARKARLLVDSLDLFYSDVGGGYGPSPVEMTNPYVKEDYDEAHVEILAYVKGGDMPWIKHKDGTDRRTEQEIQDDTSTRLPGLRMSIGKPVEKKPLAVELRMNFTQKHGKIEVRKKLSAWRDSGKITAFVYNKAGKVFKFEGHVVLTRGSYMLRSPDDKYMPVEELLVSPEEFEPPLDGVGFNFEKRAKTGPVGGMWPEK